MAYIYPDNLRAKATLMMWTLRDLLIIGGCAILGILSITKLHFTLPAVVAVVYAVLSIRIEDFSILDFLHHAALFLFDRQRFLWSQDTGKTTASAASVRSGNPGKDMT